MLLERTFGTIGTLVSRAKSKLVCQKHDWGGGTIALRSFVASVLYPVKNELKGFLEYIRVCLFRLEGQSQFSFFIQHHLVSYC